MTDNDVSNGPSASRPNIEALRTALKGYVETSEASLEYLENKVVDPWAEYCSEFSAFEQAEKECEATINSSS